MAYEPYPLTLRVTAKIDNGFFGVRRSSVAFMFFDIDNNENKDELTILSIRRQDGASIHERESDDRALKDAWKIAAVDKPPFESKVPSQLAKLTLEPTEKPTSALRDALVTGGTLEFKMSYGGEAIAPLLVKLELSLDEAESI